MWGSPGGALCAGGGQMAHFQERRAEEAADQAVLSFLSSPPRDPCLLIHSFSDHWLQAPLVSNASRTQLLSLMRSRLL